MIIRSNSRLHILVNIDNFNIRTGKMFGQVRPTCSEECGKWVKAYLKKKKEKKKKKKKPEEEEEEDKPDPMEEDDESDPMEYSVFLTFWKA